MFVNVSNSSTDTVLNSTLAPATVVVAQLPIYTSLYSLSSRVADVANVYVLPPICLMGIVTNLLCLVCILQPENRSNTVFHFMLVNTVADFCFLLICVFIFIIRCGIYCAYGYDFFSKVYEQYIYLFIGNSFLLFGTLMDITVSLNRLLSFWNTSSSKAAHKFKNISWKQRCVVLAIMAMIINTPSYLVSRNVQAIGQLVTTTTIVNASTGANHSSVTYTTTTILYSSVTNYIGVNPIGKTLLFVLTVLRGFALLIVLFVINIVISIKLKAHLKRKHKLTRIKRSNVSTVFEEATANNGGSSAKKLSGSNRRQSGSSESNITAFVLAMCSLYLVGNLPNSISPILFTVNLDSVKYNTYVVFGNFMLFLSHGSYFFIYYIYNREFRFTFNRIFCFGFGNPRATQIR